ncbi:MAG: SIS domain-containing protein [Bacteroidales bacterium]|jgi:arabinose-5-phosphate isomerase|nr:SIS domain-containing protein [Bacteroidales bacterium]
MIQSKSIEATEKFLGKAKESAAAYIDGFDLGACCEAAEIILASQAAGGRIHVTGIGKPAHVAAYVASLLSSTGNPAYFLHGTEAVHGSCGQLVAGDVVIAISNSGETAELMATVNAIHENGCKVIAVTGNPRSWLSEHSESTILAGVSEEGGPLGRAPRNSVNAEMIALQALSVLLQVEKDWDKEKYHRCHPGGKLGQMK